jgi:hypothetical protein
MTEPGSGTPGPADDTSRKRPRIVLVLVAVAAAVILLGVVADLIAQSPDGAVAQPADEADPLTTEAPHVANFKMRATGPCSYEPDRGGLVAHFDVSTSDAGRFTVDLKAVTKEGADNLDVSTTHVVRVTVPFYGGRTRKQFDVVVPLTEAEHQDGYRRCRYLVNPTGAAE